MQCSPDRLLSAVVLPWVSIKLSSVSRSPTSLSCWTKALWRCWCSPAVTALAVSSGDPSRARSTTGGSTRCASRGCPAGPFHTSGVFIYFFYSRNRLHLCQTFFILRLAFPADLWRSRWTRRPRERRPYPTTSRSTCNTSSWAGFPPKWSARPTESTSRSKAAYGTSWSTTCKWRRVFTLLLLAQEWAAAQCYDGRLLKCKWIQRLCAVSVLLSCGHHYGFVANMTWYMIKVWLITMLITQITPMSHVLVLVPELFSFPAALRLQSCSFTQH